MITIVIPSKIEPDIIWLNFMMALYSKLIGTPVAELKNQSKVGEIADFIVNNEDITIAGAIVKKENWLFSKNKVASSTDIVSLLKKGMIVNDENAITELSEISKLDTLYKKKNYGIAQKVVTKSGQYVGHVFDYLIDTSTLSIRKFYIKRLFKELLIPANSIVSFEGKTITIKEDKGFLFQQEAFETVTSN